MLFQGPLNELDVEVLEGQAGMIDTRLAGARAGEHQEVLAGPGTHQGSGGLVRLDVRTECLHVKRVGGLWMGTLIVRWLSRGARWILLWMRLRRWAAVAKRSASAAIRWIL